MRRNTALLTKQRAKELEESDNQKDSGHIKESERKYKVFCKSTQSEWQEVQQI